MILIEKDEFIVKAGQVAEYRYNFKLVAFLEFPSTCPSKPDAHSFGQVASATRQEVTVHTHQGPGDMKPQP